MPTTTLQPLTQLFPPRQVVTDPVALITYEIDAGFDRGRPDGVFFPQSTAEVSQVMCWASEQRIPLIARGAGTGLSGGAVPEHGGLVIEFARMNRVLDFDPAGRSAVVEPGVVNLALDALVKEAGLYYPPDPSSGRSSTIGGNVGENAGGPHCFKYGVTTNYVTGLEVVLAGGEVVKLGGRALDYPEYDFAGALVGSEGTLGVVTQVDVRLIRNPPGVKTMMAAFASVEQAGHAVSAVIAAGLMPATLEMMDQKIMRMIEAYAAPGLPVDAEAGLIVEVDGHPTGLDSQMEEVADILTQYGAFDLRIAQSEEERQRIWYGRKSAAGAMSRLAPTFYLVDVTAPRSRLAPMLAAVDEVCHRYDLRAGHVFHAGDGNLHPLILCDARNPELMDRVFRACDEIVTLCLQMGGSITGEHGVGIEKRKYMPAMYTGAELAAMLDLKALFDPHGLLNPGKIFPDDLPAPQRAAPALPTGDTFAPANAEGAAAGLVALAQVGKRVRIGSSAGVLGADVQLITANLGGVLEYAQNDLYITVGAGMTVAEMQRYLSQHNMQAPLAAPWPDATVGGLAAANLNAPLRMRYGALRDVVIAATVALADGRVIRAGRNVVKNVAGYDLPKLFVGSHGTLGLVTDVTLKLIPQARASRTLAIPLTQLAQGLAWAGELMPRLLATAGLILAPGELVAPGPQAPYYLLATVEGAPDDVAAELAELHAALASLGAPAAIELESPTCTQVWASFIAGAGEDALLVRAGVPPKTLPPFMAQAAPAARDGRWLIDAGNGFAYAAIATADATEAASWLAALREPALAAGGYAIALQTPVTLRGRIDPWGYRPAALHLMRGLKARWDPAGILNPGGFVV
ncbi:MAG: FAD-binding protein [Caldilineaceae bacterium]|nr:FAD-binding protein [Caldilineaceae bacterium]